jgi:hypothetical protein
MGLSPEVFWNMTLVEWRAALAGFAERRGLRTTANAGAMRRDELTRLMKLYPDVTSHG